MKDLRAQLDIIDQEMRELFEARMDIVSKVGEYKREHQIDVLDAKREAEILEHHCSRLNNKEYLESYTEFIKLQLKLSKDLQVNIIKKGNR